MATSDSRGSRTDGTQKARGNEWIAYVMGANFRGHGSTDAMIQRSTPPSNENRHEWHEHDENEGDTMKWPQISPSQWDESGEQVELQHSTRRTKG